jgi:class 3 adenylate cyclase
MAVSPTLEGFRAAFRRPSLTLGEIAWRWTVGASATTLFFYGLFEYLNTLPVTRGELLFLRSRQPYLVAQAIAHILRGSLNRAVMAALLAAMMLGLLWMVAASLGRVATVQSLLDYFRNVVGNVASNGTSGAAGIGGAVSVSASAPLRPLVRLNFLRVVVALAAILGFVGATILAGFASPDSHPRPGLAFLLFLPLAGLICLAWWALNWLLSLAGLFAARDGEDAVGAVFAAVAFCRDRTNAVFAVSTWTGLAHLIAFAGATTVVSMPLGFAGLLPWRLVVLGVILVTLAYFVLADWLYMARLAGYVCIAEMPEALLAPLPPTPLPVPTPVGMQAASGPPPQATIDRDEPILSDVPGLTIERG